MKVANGEYMTTEGSARETGLAFDADCSHDGCFAPASGYWIIYDHNELAQPPCGFQRSVILLLPYCDQHTVAVAERETGFSAAPGTHNQCMSEKSTLARVQHLFKFP